MLFHPFKQFVCPAFLVEQSDVRGTQVHVVGKENQVQTVLGAIILDSWICTFKRTKIQIFNSNRHTSKKRTMKI